MKEIDRYLKIVEWSDEDQKFVGKCPELFYGGCHGNNRVKVYKELCEIVEEVIEDYKRDGDPLPEPRLKTEYSGKFVMRVGPELHQMLAYRAYCENESLNNYCVGILREEAAVYGSKSKPTKTATPAVRGEKYPLPPKRKNCHERKRPLF